MLDTATTLLLHTTFTDFVSDTPYFTIIGKTSGGPPTDHRWSKDGIPLNNSAAFNITVVAIPQNTVVRYRDALYESTLTVVGREPGLYQYTATNQVSPTLIAVMSIEGTFISE